MTIQYAHVRQDKLDYYTGIEATVAVDVPQKEIFSKLFLTHSNQIMFLAGLAIKSDKDSFNKKTGREVSTARILPIVFNFSSISINDIKHVYDFYTNKFKVGYKNYNVRLTFTTVAESEKIKLIDAFVDYDGDNL